MDTRFLLLIFLVTVTPLAYAQNLKELLEKGDRFYNKKDFAEAVQTYQQAVHMSPDDADANFKLGLTYLYTLTKTKALIYLEKAYRAKPDVDKDIDYHLGMAYQYSHQYGKAKNHYEAFRQKNKKLADIAEHKIYECTIGDSLSRHPAYVVIESAGAGINSPFHEYSPLVTAEGNTMIFTSNRSEDDYKIKSGTNFEDIYIVYKNGGTWGAPQKISPNINIKFHDAAASVSPDGKVLFLYYEEGAGDIYTSTFDNGEWSKPMPLNKNVNSPMFWETSACISADGKKLFFTSNRPGGKGELDIYMSELDAKGSWGKAVNLGSTINTPGHEDSPFIHPDGVTLYFSSDGHPTMGSNDIFKSEFVNGRWTKPVNLGYPINSIEYDGFFSLSADKKTGFYSTIREEGMGEADIYTIRFVDPPLTPEKNVLLASHDTKMMVESATAEVIPSDAIKDEAPNVVTSADIPPAPISSSNAVVQPSVHANAEEFVDPIVKAHRDSKVFTVLKGKVIDENTASPLGAVISLVDNETQKVITKINSNSSTGDFELVVPHGGNYGVATERDGYLFNSINFNVPQFAEYQEIDMHIIMVKAEVGSKVILKNIFFDVGKAALKQESVFELEKIRELLVTNGHLKVQINGHTDNTGNVVANKALSLKRAEEVVRYLIDKGVAPERLSAKGFGSEKPLVSNDDEQEGREINRRTEIEIVEAGGGNGKNDRMIE